MRTFFPNLSEILTFAATPLVLTPICPQPKAAQGQGQAAKDQPELFIHN